MGRLLCDYFHVRSNVRAIGIAAFTPGKRALNSQLLALPDRREFFSTDPVGRIPSRNKCDFNIQSEPVAVEHNAIRRLTMSPGGISLSCRTAGCKARAAATIH